jgi:hypothetical protein
VTRDHAPAPGWRLGAHGVPRTGGTSLTDAELVACDALFDGPASRGLLLGDSFAEMFNLGYGGEAPLDEDVLDGLLGRGLLRVRGRSRASDQPVLALTAEGGALWERERQPIWEAYCCDSCWSEDDVQVVQVRAERRVLAESFWQTAAAVGLWSVPDVVPSVVIEDGAQLPYWRTTRAVVIEARWQGPPFESAADWSAYEARRIWWRLPSELLRSHGALPSLPRGREAPPLFRGEG